MESITSIDLHTFVYYVVPQHTKYPSSIIPILGLAKDCEQQTKGDISYKATCISSTESSHGKVWFVSKESGVVPYDIIIRVTVT